MEADRFGQNKVFFIVGIITLVLGLILFIISFYILPNLVFDWRYHIPVVISIFADYLQATYQLKSTAAGWLVFLGIFGTSIFLFIIADIISNKIDSEVYKDYYADNNLQAVKKNKYVGEEQDSKWLVFKIILIIIIVFVASQVFQWAISI